MVILDLFSSSFTNNHLQQWVDYLDQKEEKNQKVLTHLEIQALNHLLQVVYRNAHQLTLFKLLLDEYPSLIQLLDRVVGKSEWLAPLTRPVLSMIYLVLYKAIMESGAEFSGKQKIINTCLILLRNCGTIQRRVNDGGDGDCDGMEMMMGNIINFELLLKQNTREGDHFENVFSNMINERLYMMIHNNNNMGDIEIHLTFARLCLSFMVVLTTKNQTMMKNNNNCTLVSLMEYYLNELISRFDWSITIDDNNNQMVNEFIQEIMASKIISPQQKSIIVLSNELILMEKFSNCLNYLLKNPFKLPELHDDSKIILETLKKRPSIVLILEGFLETIYKETQHPRVFFIGNSILNGFYHQHDKRTTRLISMMAAKDEMNQRIDRLNQTISKHWIHHQYKHFQMFLIGTIYMMTALNSTSPPQSTAATDLLFEACKNYVVGFIFGSDLTKDLNFCMDSLQEFLTDLIQCKEFTPDQFMKYLNGEEDKLQSFPLNFIIYVFLCGVFVRNDAKNFSYNTVIDMSMSVIVQCCSSSSTNSHSLENEQLFIELILIFIQWLEQIIEISSTTTAATATNCTTSSFSLRQLIIILTYLKIISIMNDRVNQTDDFELKGHLSMLLSRFKFKYYENIVQQQPSSDTETSIFSQNPNNNEAKQSLINLITSTFENLYTT